MERREVLKAGVAAALLPAAMQGEAQALIAPPPRWTRLLDDGWRFHLRHAADVDKDFGWGRNQRSFAKAGCGTADAAMPKFDDSCWTEVRAPHDWAVALPFAPPEAPVPEDTRDAEAAHGFRRVVRAYPETSVRVSAAADGLRGTRLTAGAGR